MYKEEFKMNKYAEYKEAYKQLIKEAIGYNTIFRAASKDMSRKSPEDVLGKLYSMFHTQAATGTKANTTVDSLLKNMKDPFKQGQTSSTIYGGLPSVDLVTQYAKDKRLLNKSLNTADVSKYRAGDIKKVYNTLGSELKY